MRPVVFLFFLTNAVSTSDYSATDSFHTFPNSLFASDLVSEITQLIQWLIYRLDDREIEFRSPIREWNVFLSVAPRSAVGYNHTLVQWLRLGSFYPAWKKFTTRRRDCECVELYLHSPIRFMAQCLIKHMLITLSLHTLQSQLLTASLRKSVRRLPNMDLCTLSLIHRSVILFLSLFSQLFCVKRRYLPEVR